MNTPICDFVREYTESNAVRMHMPGHKGKNLLGTEALDITEISGADSLFDASGIIKESEDNASEIFGCPTFYSTEGSSLCIRAMLYLAKLWGGNPLILAGRNAHKSFFSGVAIMDLDVEWLYPDTDQSYLSGSIDINELERILSKTERKTAVYITSPDYLGNTADIKAISDICKKYGALLIVDNAHGAYLKFLPKSKHPIDLGADICCDSAHKTLSVLTGGAYLHINEKHSEMCERAKAALALFGSTSPSYLILQSLDMANAYLTGDYKSELCEFILNIKAAKERICELGYRLIDNEHLKIVIAAKEYGYSGSEIAAIIMRENIHCEFSDNDYIVFMLTPQNRKSDLDRLIAALSEIPKKERIEAKPPALRIAKRALTPREVIFAESEIVDIEDCEGRILAEFNIACPPAVPILVCGEVIGKTTIECFEYYGIKKCRVVKR